MRERDSINIGGPRLRPDPSLKNSFRKGGVKLDGSPSNLVLSVDSDTEISGIFDRGATNQDGFYAYYSTSETSGFVKATNAEAVMPGTDNTFKITGLTPLTSYYVKVVAYKGTKESDPVTASAVKTYKYLYVRPAGGSYGLEDGSSYTNAYKGFTDISWAAVVPHTVLWICGTHKEVLQPGSSGTSNEHIIFSGNYTGDQGVIDGENTRTNLVINNGKTYLEFRNLTITKAAGTCSNMTGGTNWFTNCTISTSSDQCVESNTSANVTYDGCTISGATDEAVSGHSNTVITIKNSTVTNSLAVSEVGSASITIEDSIINGYISLGCACTIRRSKIYGKLVGPNYNVSYCLFDFRWATVLAENLTGNPTGGTFDNCTFVGVGNGQILAFGGYTLVYRNCIMYDLYRTYIYTNGTINSNKSNWYSITTLALSSNTDPITGDTKFTNFAAADFTLAADSPCRDVGISLGYTRDLAGNVVPATNIDLGCYQN